jgi:thioredoxin 1
MLNRRYFIGAMAAAGALSLSPLAAAMAPQAYSEKAFAAAQAAGRPILLHVTAPWCPTCKAQKPILSKLEGEPKYKNLVAFDIDFDTSKALLRKLHVPAEHADRLPGQEGNGPLDRRHRSGLDRSAARQGDLIASMVRSRRGTSRSIPRKRESRASISVQDIFALGPRSRADERVT